MNGLLRKVAAEVLSVNPKAKVAVSDDGATPHITMSSQAASIVSDLMAKGFLDRVARSANSFLRYNRKKTLTDAELLYALRVNLPTTELRQDVTESCREHLARYSASFETAATAVEDE